MSGSSFVWVGGTANNDFYVASNWDIVQNGTTNTATVAPGASADVTLSNGGTIDVNGTENGGTLVPLSLTFAGSGGTLSLTNVTLQQGGTINISSPTTAVVQTAGTVQDEWWATVSGAGATLDVQVGSGTFDLANPLFALAQGVVNLGTGAGGTVQFDGGLVAYGGTVNANASLQGDGVVAVGGGGTVSLQALGPGATTAFVDNAGTLVVQQTGTVGTGIGGFQAGDAIDLTALSSSATPTITVNGDLTTISEGSTVVVLPFLSQGFTAGDFTTTSDGSGHLLLTTSVVDPTWGSGTSGDWSNATLWTPTSVPGTADNAVISNLGGTFDVTVTTAETAGSLLLLAPNGTLSVSAPLSLSRALLDVVGTIGVGSGGTITAAAMGQIGGGQLNLTGGALMTLTGTLTLPGFASNGFFPGVGGVGLALNGNVNVDASTIQDSSGLMLVGANGGQVNIQNSGVVYAPNALVTGQGNVAVEGGGIWNVAGELAIGGGNPGTQPGVQLFNNGSGTPSGTLTVGGPLVMTSGQFNVSGGGSANVAGNVTLQGGTISTDSTTSSVLNIGTVGAGGTGGVVVDAGATLSIANGEIDTFSLTDNGLILVNGSARLNGGAITGSGTIEVASGSVLMLPSSGPITTAIDFSGGGSTLVLSDPIAVQSQINIAQPAGSGLSNIIDINTLTYNPGNTVSYDATLGVLLINNGGDGTLHIGTGLSGDWSVTADASGNTEIIINAAPCYAEGTRLATPGGEVAVEALRPGDAVLALENGAWVARCVRWVGRTTVDLSRHPEPERAAPVRIRAGAFADGRPHRDLVLSPEHAVFVDGVLMQAQALLNGASITREFPRQITYLHVELDAHSVLCAEGLPAESYLDTGNRGAFLGERGVRALHPDFASAAAWDECACAELVLQGPRLEAVRARLRARAAALGFMLTDDPDLAVEAAGLSLRPNATGCVRLPAGTRQVRLTSRSFVPLWLGMGEDRRRLGVAVTGLWLDGEPLPAAAFGAGWHPAESGWRWTDGDAELCLSPLSRPAILQIALADWGVRYWAARPGQRAGAVRAA
jgi:hypothetical protein